MKHVTMLQVDLDLSSTQRDALVAALRDRDMAMDLVVRRRARLTAAVQAAAAADDSDVNNVALLQMVGVLHPTGRS